MNFKDTLIDVLHSRESYKKIEELNNNNILNNIIPEVNEMKLVGECKYHKVDVYTHSIKALKELEESIHDEDFLSSHLKDKINEYLNINVDDGLNKYELLKLGVFLHDIGKYASKTIDDSGRVHFKGHEITGSQISKKLCNEIDLSEKITNLLCKYVENHMYLLVLYKTNDMSKERLWSIFEKLEDDTIGIMLLGYADIVATRKLLNPNEDTGIIKTYMEYVLTNYIYRYKK